jgi:hypothetical protein
MPAARRFFHGFGCGALNERRGRQFRKLTCRDNHRRELFISE